MARPKTSKERSLAQENMVAILYAGSRSKSSGANPADPGDVREDRELIECKTTGEPGKPYPKSASFTVETFEKIADEAWSIGRYPTLALQLYNPDSVLSDRSGMINFIVRLMDDDIQRKWKN